MGLPQEVVERIMIMLQDDGNALRACSLTCRSMFASTRHLIHQTLYLTSQNSRRIFTPAEKKRYRRGDYEELELRFLSFMGERDLLKYTRHLNIRIGFMFSPYVLEPHLHHLRSLDKTHTLTIRLYNAPLWCGVSNTHFTQLYPTLTTLVLLFPIGHHHYVLQFALQFPNLENLTLEYLRDETRIFPGIPVSPMVTQCPPLRGYLRCAGLSLRCSEWPRNLAFGLPKSTNFRSIEFQDVNLEQGQQILDGCAGSLEEFTVHITGYGKNESLPRFLCVTET